MTEPRLPDSDGEWQECVDLAHGLLAIQSAREYGLITGGPHCDTDRCVELLELGKARGFTPSATASEDTIALFLAAEHG